MDDLILISVAGAIALGVGYIQLHAMNYITLDATTPNSTYFHRTTSSDEPKISVIGFCKYMMNKPGAYD